MKAVQLYNVSVARGKMAKEIIARNIPYGLACLKRKQLVASGTVLRHVWIEKVDIPKTQLSR